MGNKTKAVCIGGLRMGAGAPISVQSMTNTYTCLLYTSYHIAFNQRCGFVTYHMPMVTALPDACEYSLSRIKTMLFDGSADYANPEGFPRETLVPGKAEGTLCGGNLSLIAASLGTCLLYTSGTWAVQLRNGR